MDSVTSDSYFKDEYQKYTLIQWAANTWEGLEESITGHKKMYAQEPLIDEEMDCG